MDCLRAMCWDSTWNAARNFQTPCGPGVATWLCWHVARCCTTVLSLYFKPVALTVSVAFRTDFNFFEVAMRDLHGIARMMLDGGICLASNLISLWLCNQREVPAGSFLSTFRFVIRASFQPKCGTQRTTKWLSAALDTVHTPKPQLWKQPQMPNAESTPRKRSEPQFDCCWCRWWGKPEFWP